MARENQAASFYFGSGGAALQDFSGYAGSEGAAGSWES
jgi:hypothetical protein